MLPSHNVKVRGDAVLYTQASYGLPSSVPTSTQSTNNCASTTRKCVFIVSPIKILIQILFIWWIIADRNNNDIDDDDSNDRFMVWTFVCACVCLATRVVPIVAIVQQ